MFVTSVSLLIIDVDTLGYTCAHLAAVHGKSGVIQALMKGWSGRTHEGLNAKCHRTHSPSAPPPGPLSG